MLLSFVFILWKRSHNLSSEIARINAETTAKQNEFKTLKFDQAVAQAASVEKWLATAVNWLDELDRLSREWRPEPLDSKKYPVADDAVISQLVAFRPPGNESVGGRIAVHEIMIGIPAIRNLIREDKVAQMYSAIQTGQQHGMQTLDQNLQDLVKRGLIARQEAVGYAKNKDIFK